MIEKERHKITPASYIILKSNNKILLSRRYNTWYEDAKYALVAWHVEKWETFTDTVLRETKEEIGIDLDKNSLKVVHIMQRNSHVSLNYHERLDTFFVCEKWSWEIKNMEPNKCSELSWFDIDNLPDDMVEYTRKVLEDYYKNWIFYSEYWY